MNITPESFGRDAHYDQPNSLPIIRSEKEQHIHLANPQSPWPLYKVQYNKTSDTHYALLAILSPDAHKQAKNNDIMYRLGKMAELFRLNH